MTQIGQAKWALKSLRKAATAFKLGIAAVLCFLLVTGYAASPIATVSFTAIIDRVGAPDGVAVPDNLAKGKQVDGSISFSNGDRRDSHSKGDMYYWRAQDGGTVSLSLGKPLNSSIENLVIRVDATKKKVNIVCIFVCKMSGGVTLVSDGPSWQLTRSYLLAPGVVPADLSQMQAIERLVKLSNGKQTKILVNYKENLDDSDVKAVRVVLSIDSMEMK